MLEYLEGYGLDPDQPRGVKQQSPKKLHSILRYVESSRGFTEIKQVIIQSSQLGDPFLEHLEHHYVVRMSRKYLPCRENCMLLIAAASQKYF